MLSPLIEYLFAQNRLTGGRLCHPSKTQYYVEIPPGMTILFNLIPPLNAHAAIKYASTIADDVVPGAFFFDTVQAGDSYGPGWDYPDWNREFLPYFIIFSESLPISARVVNTSNVNQHLSGGQWNLVIPQEADYHEMMKRIDRYCGKTRDKELQEGNNLLQQMVTFVTRGQR